MPEPSPSDCDADAAMPEPACPPLAKQRLDHVERSQAIVVGPRPEPHVEIVDDDESRHVGAASHRIEQPVQHVPHRAACTADDERRSRAVHRGHGRRGRSERTGAAAARGTEHEEVPVGGRGPGREAAALMLGFVDEADREHVGLLGGDATGHPGRTGRDACGPHECIEVGSFHATRQRVDPWSAGARRCGARDPRRSHGFDVGDGGLESHRTPVAAVDDATARGVGRDLGRQTRSRRRRGCRLAASPATTPGSRSWP